MRKLNLEEIEMLASRKGVKRIAVENFLMSIGLAGSKADELYNLGMDAQLYNWNPATRAAIRLGIAMAYKG